MEEIEGRIGEEVLICSGLAQIERHGEYGPTRHRIVPTRARCKQHVDLELVATERGVRRACAIRVAVDAVGRPKQLAEHVDIDVVQLGVVRGTTRRECIQQVPCAAAQRAW